MSEYEAVAKAPLKLKIGSSGISKKKKKHKIEIKDIVKQVKVDEEVKKYAQTESLRTKAELAFLKQQEKMQEERIKKKASMTHKQRVEDLNRHLDSLTEHFDIPKVSWTK